MTGFQLEKNISENMRGQVDKSIDQLHLSKSFPNVNFNLSCEEICR